MLFEQQYAQLFRAVDRIKAQMEQADAQQREYLYDELQALREINTRCLKMWMAFEDKVQDVYERFFPESLDDMQNASLSPATSASVALVSEADYGTLLHTDGGMNLFRQGMGYFDLLMFDESICSFEQMVAMDPDMLMARLFLALAYIAQKRYEEAERQLSIILLAAHDSALQAAAREAKALMFVRQDRHRDAIAELQRLVAQRPDYIDAHVNLAICAYAVTDYRLSLAAAAKAVELDHADGMAWRLSGAALYALGRPKKALEAYRKAVVIVPNEPSVVLEMAIILRRLHRLDEAQSLYRKLLRERQEPSAALAGLGELALKKQDYGRATALFKKQAALDRHSPDSLRRLAWALYADGRFDEAERVFHAHVRDFGADVTVLTGLARLAAARGEMQEARQYLRRVLHCPDERAMAHGLAELGRLAIELGDYAKAIRYLQSALGIDRSQEDALIYLGIALRASQGDTDSGHPIAGLPSTLVMQGDARD